MGRQRQVGVEDVRGAVERLRIGGQAVGIVSVMALTGGSHRVVRELLDAVLIEERGAAVAAGEVVQPGQELVAPSPLPEPLMPLLRGLAASWEEVVTVERRRAEEMEAVAERSAAARVQAAEGALAAERLLREQTEAELLRVQEALDRAERRLRQSDRQRPAVPAPAPAVPAPAAVAEPARREPRPITDAVRQRIDALRAEGRDWAAVGLAVGHRASRVRRDWEQRHPAAAGEEAPAAGQRRPLRPFSVEERERVATLRAAGAGPAEIGKALGRDRGSIANLLKRLDAEGSPAQA